MTKIRGNKLQEPEERDLINKVGTFLNREPPHLHYIEPLGHDRYKLAFVSDLTTRERDYELLYNHRTQKLRYCRWQDRWGYNDRAWKLEIYFFGCYCFGPCDHKVSRISQSWLYPILHKVYYDLLGIDRPEL